MLSFVLILLSNSSPILLLFLHSFLGDPWPLLFSIPSLPLSSSPPSSLPLHCSSRSCPFSDDKQTFEAQLVNRLREIMLGVDLEEVSSKQLRLKLEEEMKMDLKAYREFLDQQMLVILGQLEKPSKICDYLYLVSVPWD